LIEVRYTKLRFAERIQPVLVGPFGREENARSKNNVLQMTVHSNGSDVGEGKGSECGRIPGGVVVSGNRYSLCEEPRAANVEAIGSVVSGYVSIAAADLQSLSAHGRGKCECRQ
jgi:hypothetical protein